MNEEMSTNFFKHLMKWEEESEVGGGGGGLHTCRTPKVVPYPDWCETTTSNSP